MSVLYEFQIDISTDSWQIKYQNMLNVAHVKNDVKWRPIVTKFGTLIENMSRTGLYGCHTYVKYWRIFGDVISLFAPVFIVSVDRAYKEVHTKK